MTTFAVSDFMNTLFIIMIATPFILLWTAAVVDVIRSHRSGLALVGWLLVILCLPFFGPLIYLAIRAPEQNAADIERHYMAQRELDRVAAAAPIGGTGIR